MSVPTAKGSALHTMTRRRRRWLIMAMQIGMVAYALAFTFAGANSLWLVLLILCLQALYMLIFFWMLRPVAREISDRNVSDLDERQIAVRDRAHHHAYQVLAMVILTVTAAPMAASLYFGVDLPLQMTAWHFVGLFLFFMNLGVSLPASVIAWTEPDPEPENESPWERERGEA